MAAEDNPSLIEDARNSLLAHYSSKSTNQTAMLLGLAIAFFADIQAVDVLYETLHVPLQWIILFIVFSVGLITFIGIRAIGRLIVWEN